MAQLRFGSVVAVAAATIVVIVDVVAANAAVHYNHSFVVCVMILCVNTGVALRVWNVNLSLFGQV
jgi:hypothetical protein